jgi:hypothetical protein
VVVVKSKVLGERNRKREVRRKVGDEITHTHTLGRDRERAKKSPLLTNPHIELVVVVFLVRLFN